MTPLQFLLIDIVLVLFFIYEDRYVNVSNDWGKVIGGLAVILLPILSIICIIYYVKV